MAITFCSISLEVIAVASAGETHASHQEKVMSLQMVWVCSGKKRPTCGNLKKSKCNSSSNMPRYLLKRQFEEVQSDFD